MPTFDTPTAIAVTVELGAGDVRVIASDRVDTVVEVRPGDSTSSSDVIAAQRCRVEYANGILLIKAPREWRRYSFRGGADSIDVQIELPVASHIRGQAGIAALHCTGRLGECRYRTGLGDIQIDEAGLVELKTGGGDIAVGRTIGYAEVTTGFGAVRIGSVDGAAVIKNSNGDTWIGEVTGDLRVSAANGTIAVDQAHASVAAKTANGDVRLGEVTRGAIVAQTAVGKVDIGIRDGVAAWLDLTTSFGTVQNDLEATARPEPGEDAVEVRGRTAYGDVTVRRSSARATTSDLVDDAP